MVIKKTEKLIWKMKKKRKVKENNNFGLPYEADKNM